MPNLIVPDYYREQPRLITLVDKSHWLARGLRVAYNPAAGLVNLVNNRLALQSIPAIPSLITRRDLVLCREGAFALEAIVPPPLTIHTPLIFDGSGLSDRICGVQGSGSGWRYETASNNVQFTFGGVANYSSSAILNMAADYDTRLFGVTTVVTAATGGEVRFFADGVLVSNMATGTYIPSSTNFDTGDATCALVLLWNRALSDAEVMAVSANPWQIFQKSSEVYFAAGGAFQPAWAVNANSTIQSRLAA